MSRHAASGDIFQAISDPPVALFSTNYGYGEQPVKLAEPFDMSLPAISQHLRVLCETGLVIQQRTGRQRITAKSRAAQTDF